ncbi:hypothetical protein CYQ82_01045 [Enterococcus faecium]|nr:hypothetical protein B1P90_04260 [Enterococcus faecium]OOL53979.1 hypothetical protein B1P96_12415 [Enterococcus faecium]RCN73932.1 hypothetical protein B1155_06430 [Enterococcus faecium]RXW44857.1 hypothetical protein CYQ82_01045 [Enterococcus faecium]RXW79258.1 hypothetical protein CYQ67_00165 [Enterococcus faecium]
MIIISTYAPLIKHFSFTQLLKMAIKNMYLNLSFVKLVYYCKIVQKAINTKKKYIDTFGKTT